MMKDEDWKSTKLGRGAFGIVTLYKNEKNNATLVIKEAIEQNMNERMKDRWSLECEKMVQLNHPYIVKGLELPESLAHLNNPNSPVLAMEYCNAGDLRKKINKSINIYGFEEYQVKIIAHDVTEAIIYLHTNKIFHRDLKPENILMNRKPGERIIYKITDLGYAKEISDSCNCYSFVGTPQYLAPELLTDRSYDGKVDYWSLAITLFECTTGFRPFALTEYKDNLKEVINKKQEKDIYVFMEGNELRFNHLLPFSNRISLVTKSQLEEWFRLMLRFEPIGRGGVFDYNSGTFECFKLLEKILFTKQVLLYDAQKNQYHDNRDNHIFDEFTFIIDKNGDLLKEEFEKFSFYTSYDMNMSTKHGDLILYFFNCNATKIQKQDALSNPYLEAMKRKAFDRIYKCQSNCSKFLTHHAYEALKCVEKQSKALLALCAFYEREKEKLSEYKGKLKGLEFYIEDLFHSCDEVKKILSNPKIHCLDTQNHTDQSNERKWIILEKREKAEQLSHRAAEQKSQVDNRGLKDSIERHIKNMQKHYDNASRIENEVKRFTQASNTRPEMVELMAQCLNECDHDNDCILNFYLTKMNLILSFTKLMLQLEELLKELRKAAKDLLEYRNQAYNAVLLNILEPKESTGTTDSKTSINSLNTSVDNLYNINNEDDRRHNNLNDNNNNNNNISNNKNNNKLTNNNNNNEDRSITHELCMQSLNLIKKVERLLEIDTEKMAALNI